MNENEQEDGSSLRQLWMAWTLQQEPRVVASETGNCKRILDHESERQSARFEVMQHLSNIETIRRFWYLVRKKCFPNSPSSTAIFRLLSISFVKILSALPVILNVAVVW